jgi:hypothetical protein
MKTYQHMLRLVPPDAAAAAAAADVPDMAAAAAAGGGDRAAAAAAPRGWVPPGSIKPDTAADVLKIKHVPDLLAQEFKPVLPEGDDWLADVIWDIDDVIMGAAARSAGGAGAAGGPASVSQLMQQQSTAGRDLLQLPPGQQPGLVKTNSDAVQQQQQQQSLLVQQDGLLLNGCSKVLWDLNDPNMMFEAPAAGLFMHAAATVLQAPPKVCVGIAT